MSRRKVDKLIFEVADILPQRAAELREQASGRPLDEEQEILDAAASMSRLYARLTNRARARWSKERQGQSNSEVGV